LEEFFCRKLREELFLLTPPGQADGTPDAKLRAWCATLPPRTPLLRS
jgi:hypothetical protein